MHSDSPRIRADLEMTDALGWRMKFGVIAPSTNTVVQPEFDMMRPRGVTNHFARIHIPNAPILGDADFEKLIAAGRGELLAAVDRVMTCEPREPNSIFRFPVPRNGWIFEDGNRHRATKAVSNGGES